MTEVCKNEGCGTTPVYALGWCHRCYDREYQRRRRAAKPPFIGPRKPRRPAHIKTYPGMHQRLARLRGRASEQVCVDCGEQAYHWSYAGGCPDEMIDFTVKPPNGFLFCDHIEHYEPRCVPCHWKHDQPIKPKPLPPNAMGENNPTVKITEAVVRAIRTEYAAGGVRQQDLAVKYGIDQTTVSKIVRRKTWPHVI